VICAELQLLAYALLQRTDVRSYFTNSTANHVSLNIHNLSENRDSRSFSKLPPGCGGGGGSRMLKGCFVLSKGVISCLLYCVMLFAVSKVCCVACAIVLKDILHCQNWRSLGVLRCIVLFCVDASASAS
jgi:hypothetical protein